jgi:hypothetical protein
MNEPGLLIFSHSRSVTPLWGLGRNRVSPTVCKGEELGIAYLEVNLNCECLRWQCRGEYLDVIGRKGARGSVVG